MFQILDWWLHSLASHQGWTRLGLLLVSWVGLWLPLAIPIALKLQWQPFQPLTAAQKLPLLAPLYLVAPLVLWGLLLATNQSWSYYGLLWSPDLFISILRGLAISILSLIVVFGWEWSQGWLTWHRENYHQLFVNALPILVLALWIGSTEEVIFRGCLQHELQTDYGFWVAGAIASVIFALLHLIWERQQTLPQIPGLVLMGMVLTLAKLTDRDTLGLAIGLHAGWVWCLTCIDAAQLITYQESGSPWLIGWNQQPLAGLAGIVCLLIATVSLLII